MDRQKIERSIKGLSEWQMHVQAESDIDTNISTAIEALKAQLSQEGTTSDQPVATDTNVGSNSEIPNRSDCISRQAAIEALDFGAEYLRRVLDVVDLVGVEREKYKWGLGLIEACIVDLKELPPAQPEPHEGQWVDGRCNKCGGHAPFWCLASTYYESDFCPCCGAKMKGATT